MANDITITFYDQNFGSDNEDSYEIYRGLGGDPCPNNDNTGITPYDTISPTPSHSASENRSYVDTNPSPGSYHFYRVNLVRGSSSLLGGLIGPIYYPDTNDIGFPGLFPSDTNSNVSYSLSKAPVDYKSAAKELGRLGSGSNSFIYNPSSKVAVSIINKNYGTGGPFFDELTGCRNSANLAGSQIGSYGVNMFRPKGYAQDSAGALSNVPVFCINPQDPESDGDTGKPGWNKGIPARTPHCGIADKFNIPFIAKDRIKTYDPAFHIDHATFAILLSGYPSHNATSGSIEHVNVNLCPYGLKDNQSSNARYIYNTDGTEWKTTYPYGIDHPDGKYYNGFSSHPMAPFGMHGYGSYVDNTGNPYTTSNPTCNFQSPHGIAGNGWANYGHEYHPFPGTENTLMLDGLTSGGNLRTTAINTFDPGYMHLLIFQRAPDSTIKIWLDGHLVLRIDSLVCRWLMDSDPTAAAQTNGPCFAKVSPWDTLTTSAANSWSGYLSSLTGTYPGPNRDNIWMPWKLTSLFPSFYLNNMGGISKDFAASTYDNGCEYAEKMLFLDELTQSDINSLSAYFISKFGSVLDLDHFGDFSPWPSNLPANPTVGTIINDIGVQYEYVETVPGNGAYGASAVGHWRCNRIKSAFDTP